MIILLCLRIDQTAGDYASSQSLGDVWWLIFCPASVSPSKRVPLKLCYLQLMTIIFFHFVSMHNWNENIFILWLASYDFIVVFRYFFAFANVADPKRVNGFAKSEREKKWIYEINELYSYHVAFWNVPTHSESIYRHPKKNTTT